MNPGSGIFPYLEMNWNNWLRYLFLVTSGILLLRCVLDCAYLHQNHICTGLSPYLFRAVSQNFLRVCLRATDLSKSPNKTKTHSSHSSWAFLPLSEGPFIVNISSTFSYVPLPPFLVSFLSPRSKPEKFLWEVSPSLRDQILKIQLVRL